MEWWEDKRGNSMSFKQDAQLKQLQIEAAEAALEDYYNKRKPIGSFYDIPSAEQEAQMQSEYERVTPEQNRQRFERVKAERMQELAGTQRPLTQIQDQYFNRDIQQYNPDVIPKFQSKRKLFEEEKGYSPDIPLSALGSVAEANKNIAQAKKFGSETSGTGTKFVYVNQEDVNDVSLTPKEGYIPIKAPSFYAQEKADARAEENRAAVQNRFETSFNKPTPLASSQVDNLTATLNAMGRAENIKSQFMDLLAQGKVPVDPVKGRFSELVQKVGFSNDKELIGFQTDVRGQFLSYLNEISGSQVTVGEANRLKSLIPTVGSTPVQFGTQLDKFYEELDRGLKNRIKVLKAANFRIGDLGVENPSIQKPDPLGIR